MTKFNGIDYKYTHVFMIHNHDCRTCDNDTPHSYALLSTNKAFTNTVRVKQCSICETISEAPLGEID